MPTVSLNYNARCFKLGSKPVRYLTPMYLPSHRKRRNFIGIYSHVRYRLPE